MLHAPDSSKAVARDRRVHFPPHTFFETGCTLWSVKVDSTGFYSIRCLAFASSNTLPLHLSAPPFSADSCGLRLNQDTPRSVPFTSRDANPGHACFEFTFDHPQETQR